MSRRVCGEDKGGGLDDAKKPFLSLKTYEEDEGKQKNERKGFLKNSRRPDAACHKDKKVCHKAGKPAPYGSETLEYARKRPKSGLFLFFLA